MTEHPTANLIRGGYQAFGTGDMAALDALFADDVVWHVSGRSSMAGDFKGKQQVFAQFGLLMERTGGTFALELHDIIGGDGHTVALATATANREGRQLNARNVDIFHVVDGRVTEMWSGTLDPYEADEFWA